MSVEGKATKTELAAVLSENNKYYLPKERYKELKWFCRQYPMWVSSYNSLHAFSKNIESEAEGYKQYEDKTAEIAIAMEHFKSKISMIDDCAKSCIEEGLVDFIIKGATEGYSFTYLKHTLHMPCCQQYYYDNLRKFYRVLSDARD